MTIPVKNGEHCWNDILDHHGNECKVLISKSFENKYLLQCDTFEIEEEFNSIKSLQDFLESTLGCSVGSFCCDG